MSESERAPEPAVGLIRPVTDFYARVLGSPRLAHHFDGAAMEALIAKQTAFISAALTGDARYSADELARVHARLAIRDDEFDELISILRSTLEDHGVGPEKKQLVVAAFEGYRRDIVSGSRALS